MTGSRPLCRLLPSFFAILTYLPCTVTGRQGDSPGLLLVMLDGFRHDYLKQSDLSLPGFQKLARAGVRVEGLVPEFPSLTFPNWYTLMTGLHVESHGLSGNFLYDEESGGRFLFASDVASANFWQGAEPLWITAVKQNKRSHLFHWCGCELEIRGRLPTFCLPYVDVPTNQEFKSSLDTSLALLRTGETDVAAVYYEKVDRVGHNYGPYSAELNQTLLDLDPIISDLVDRVSDPEMSEVNLMVFSDHGMTSLSGSRVIDLSQVLAGSDVITVMEGSPIASIYTAPGKEQEVYDELKGFHPNLTVYHRSDLPQGWRFKHGRYVAPLTAVADLGWFIKVPEEEGVPRYPFYKGMHGFDNAHLEMQGIFLAMGPAFQKGRSVERLRTVDLYQMMCHVLQLTPNPHNGTFSDVISLLTSHDDAVVTSQYVWFFMIVIIAVSVLWLYKTPAGR